MTVDYNVDLLKDLVTQFQGQPKLQALMEVIEEQMQELCDFFTDLQTKRTLMEAEGKQLDGIGDIAVLSRGEAGEWACIDTSVEVLPDDDYRRYLIFKIWKNTNNCTYYDVQKAFQMFWDRPLFYREDPDYPAVMLFDTEVLRPGQMDVQKLFNLPIIRAAGVGIFIRAITEMEEIQQELALGSHFGHGMAITHLPEWYPKWPEEKSLWVSGAMPRWTKTILPGALPEPEPEPEPGPGPEPEPDLYFEASENIENRSIDIEHNLELEIWEEPSNSSLNILGSNIAAEEDGTTLVLTGG